MDGPISLLGSTVVLPLSLKFPFGSTVVLPLSLKLPFGGPRWSRVCSVRNGQRRIRAASSCPTALEVAQYDRRPITLGQP